MRRGTQAGNIYKDLGLGRLLNNGQQAREEGSQRVTYMTRVEEPKNLQYNRHTITDEEIYHTIPVKRTLSRCTAQYSWRERYPAYRRQFSKSPTEPFFKSIDNVKLTILLQLNSLQ